MKKKEKQRSKTQVAFSTEGRHRPSHLLIETAAEIFAHHSRKAGPREIQSLAPRFCRNDAGGA
jgi:hypothetical protein